MNLNLRFFLHVFMPFALGYYLSYFFRVVNGVIAEPVAMELGLGPASLGWIGSAYFLFFASSQLPLGVLLDRYDTRKVASYILIIAAIGSLTFAFAQSALMLWLGRGLIGLGVSACLMAAFRAYAALLPPERLPLVNGLQLASGGLGALTATLPVELMLPLIGWRGLFVGLAVLSLLLAVLVRLRVPPILPTTDKPVALSVQIKESLAIFRHPLFLRIAPASVINQALYVALLSLWAAIWLRQVDGYSQAATADLLLWSAAGMVVGFLTLGWLASRLQSLGISTSLVSIICMVLFLILLVLVLIRAQLPATPLWFLLGLFSTAGALMYAALSQGFPKSLSGRVNTALNLMVFISAFLLQWLIGVMVSLWQPLENGFYPVQAYQVSIGICAAVQALALAWYFVGHRGRAKTQATDTAA